MMWWRKILMEILVNGYQDVSGIGNSISDDNKFWLGKKLESDMVEMKY